jgi:ubiquitin C-terminal hydrolase
VFIRNATLQCLLNTPRLVDVFDSKHVKYKDKYGITEGFTELIKNVKMKEYGSVTPHDVKSSVSRKNRIFAGYQQHDAHEFLVHFLEGLSEETNRVTRKGAYQELDYDPKRTRQENVGHL